MVSNTTAPQARTFASELHSEISNFLDNSLRRCTITCLNCEHFNGGRETCNVNNNKRPPASVIAFGCPAFKYNDLPF